MVYPVFGAIKLHAIVVTRGWGSVRKINGDSPLPAGIFAIALATLVSGLTALQSRSQTPVRETGFVFEGEGTMNRVSALMVEYTGECPGKDEPPDMTAWFISDSTPTGRRRRVRITNVTTGLDPNRLPYTDRGYDQNKSSEKISFRFGNKHGDSRFRVRPGLNQFQYQIREGNDRILEEGTFAANFDLETRSQVRNSQLISSQVCANSSISLNRCADIRTENKWQCPNGSVVRREISPPGPPQTVIRNDSPDTVYFQVNNGDRVLGPGEAMELRGNSPGSVRYSQSSGDRLNRTMFLQPAVLYRFRRSGNSLNLVDR